MDFIERMAEKVIPFFVTAIIVAVFNMYDDVGDLKEKAVDYKERADKLHEEMREDLKRCTKNDIIQNKDIEFLKLK